MQALKKVPGVRLAAVCDVYEPHLAEGRKIADANAFATPHYHEVLARKDIDAVLIGSPDHWHVPMTVDACGAGKDVYVEKPLTHDLGEGQAVIDSQNRHHRIVQVGTQQRSMTHLIEARELVRAGRIGPVIKVHMTWNRNSDRVRKNRLGIDPGKVDWKAFVGKARPQPFDEYRFRNWRWFWDFGGGLLTDLMVHWIDTVHWMLPESGQALRAVSIGNHFRAKDVWETPDTVQTLLAYETFQAYFEGTFANARNRAMVEFMGTEGTLYCDRGRYEIYPERGKGRMEEHVLGSGERGKDFYDKPDGELLHLTNWVECIRSRKKPNCPAEEGVKAAASAHLANLALRTGQPATMATATGNKQG
jgi:predicted dehydrogenase